MGDEGGFESERTWLRRAAVLLRREPKLQWKVPALFVGGILLGGAVNAYEYGLQTSQVLTGLGWGVVIGLAFAFITLENRMETVFPDHGDDEEDAADAEDSLRARYVRGDIDHETFTRRLDEKLREPMGDGEQLPQGDEADRTDDPVALLKTRFARGEIDEEEYRERLATLRETDDAPAAVDDARGDPEPERE